MKRKIRRECPRTDSLLMAAIGVASSIAVAASAVFAKAMPAQLCVNHTGSGGCFTTIQGAVNTVPVGGSAVITIVADVTPYAEQVAVSGITVSFVGAGPGMTVIDGTNTSGVPTFSFQNNSNGELSGLTIENGNGGIGSNVSFQQEGPKEQFAGTLFIEDCEITGGVHPSTILPNGTIYFEGKSLVVDSSSITNNSDKGLTVIGPKASITNTTISGNSTAGNHGNATGCGIHFTDTTAVVNNVTITDNQCVGGTGMDQSPTEGGGIWLDFTAKVTMANSIIANNTVSGSMPAGPDCFTAGKTLKSKGFNLIKDTSSCDIKLAKTDIGPGTDPELGSFDTCASSGLEVLIPLGGSPAIGAGNPNTPKGKIGAKPSTCLPADECGAMRNKGSCSIGAVE